MGIEALAASAAAGMSPTMGAVQVRQVELGPVSGGTPEQADKFRAAFARANEASGVPGPNSVSPTMKGMLNALDSVNLNAKSVADYASEVERSGGTLTPGEMVNLTMKCQEFMFQCQLTSSIANKSSDGIQQLFRQQG